MNITELAMLKKMAGNGGGNGGSVELDTTLTQAGKAADAKAVGDALANKANKTDLNNYASKTYVDNAVANAGGGGGGGGTSGGLSIKKIEFTDRPTMWNWVSRNYTEVLKVALSASLSPVPLLFNAVQPYYSNNNLSSITFCSVYPEDIDATEFEINIMFVNVNSERMSALMGSKGVTLSDDGVSVGDGTPSDIPDAYWAQLSAKFTVYYIG